MPQTILSLQATARLTKDLATEDVSPMLHWTLGGPWFREQRTMGGPLAAEWFSARDDAMKLWD